MGIFDQANKAQADVASIAQQGGGLGMSAYGAAAGETQALADTADALAPTGPEFEPIEDIGWDRYIDLCILMAPAGTDTAKHEEIAVANGVPAGHWTGIAQAWMDRLMANKTLMQKFSLEYGRKTGMRS
jgi:hypothetical protein